MTDIIRPREVHIQIESTSLVSGEKTQTRSVYAEHGSTNLQIEASPSRGAGPLLSLYVTNRDIKKTGRMKLELERAAAVGAIKKMIEVLAIKPEELA